MRPYLIGSLIGTFGSHAVRFALEAGWLGAPPEPTRNPAANFWFCCFMILTTVLVDAAVALSKP